MTGWNIGVGVVVLLVLLALVIVPRRAARRRAQGQGDGAGFWMTGDTGRADPARDKASPPDADDTGGGDGGD